MIYDSRPPGTARKGRKIWDRVEAHAQSFGEDFAIREIFSGSAGAWYFVIFSPARREIGSPYFKIEGSIGSTGSLTAEWSSARGSWSSS